LEFPPLGAGSPRLVTASAVLPGDHRLLPSEYGRIVWTFIHHAARLSNGIRVGEMTSAVMPWQHQIALTRGSLSFVKIGIREKANFHDGRAVCSSSRAKR
jgi:hypothetical protein